MDITESKRDDRQIRVFISSTFRDMQAERDYLVKFIFPQLRKLCESRAVTWTEVDLRWGITDKESSEGKVLPLCLAEIERCRPYFIGLLGERYGWVPERYPENLMDEQPWLKEHLNHSVTELEIIHGVLKSPQMLDRSLFYFRDPKYIDKLPEEKKKEFIAENPEHAAHLKQLKQRIREEHETGKLKFAPRENYPTPEALGEMILEDFTQIIDILYPAEEVPDPLDQEAARHEAYACSRRLAFIGREKLLEQITNHVATADKPLTLTGDSGCGKSALLAEWLARWRKNHPEDIVIQHYIGSTPESADWQGLVRRILGELKRTYKISDDLPIQTDALRTALNDWFVKVAGEGRIILVMDALNQLTEADAAHQLGWLPAVFPPNVHVLVSTLTGDTLQAVERHQWPQLEVPLFSTEDIAPATKAYFNVFSKTPDDYMIQLLEAASAAANPLYLRAVLDEMRQFGDHEQLHERTQWYLAAKDLPSLFDRILSRWDEDYGKDLEYPDLVRRSLCMITCSRFGLSESELLDLLAKKDEEGDIIPLPRRYWTPFYLAAENSLSIRVGLLNFGHDYLRTATHKRWLTDEQVDAGFRTHLADYFARIPESTDRKLDELPTLLRDTEQWTRLKDLLTDIFTFLRLRSTQRWKWELHGYWILLRKYFSPGEAYHKSLSKLEVTNIKDEEISYLYDAVSKFRQDAGDYGSAESLSRRALRIRVRVLGLEHADTLQNMNNLAILLESRGDYTAAEPLLRQALEVQEGILGPEHSDTLASVQNLAVLLVTKGDYMEAETLLLRALEAQEQILGPEHPQMLTSFQNLGELLRRKGDFAAAEPLLRPAMESKERVLGPQHPRTLNSINNLGHLLVCKGDYAAAETLLRRALKIYERVMGSEHPQTLTSMNNLAHLLMCKKDYSAAEPLFRQTLESKERILGPQHPSTLASVNNLGELLREKGDYTAAEPLLRRALEGLLRFSATMRKVHPDLNTSITNYTTVLESMGQSGWQIQTHLAEILRRYGMKRG